MKKLQGEVGVAMEQARRAVVEACKGRVQIKYESGKRHLLAVKVAELEREVRELKDTLGVTQRESADRRAAAERLQ
eukprot:4684667-Pleurochrysis_carterae.AAC.1